MGSNFDYGWSDINQAFAAGQVGMYVSGSDVYTNLVQASEINPKIYGLAPIPPAKNKTAGVLGGGTLVAVRPDANTATKAAAMKWIDFYYEQPLVAKAQAIRNAKRSWRESSPSAFRRSPSSTRRSTTSPTRGSSLTSRAARADEAVHDGHLRPEPRSRAGGVDPERVPLTRRGGGGGPDEPERRHREPAEGSEQ